jgi:hypothetical protein
MTDIRNFRLIDRRTIAETREPLPDGSFDFKFTRTTEWKQLLCEQLGLFSQKGSVVANQSIAINVGCLSSDETFELLEKVEAFNVAQQTNANRLRYDTEVAKLSAKRKDIVIKAKAKGLGKKKVSQTLKNSKLSTMLTDLAVELESWQAKDLPKEIFSAVFTTIPDNATQSILRDILSGEKTIAEGISYGNDLKAQVFDYLHYHSAYITYLTLPYHAVH